jgi:hypothetical protein
MKKKVKNKNLTYWPLPKKNLAAGPLPIRTSSSVTQTTTKTPLEHSDHHQALFYINIFML